MNPAAVAAYYKQGWSIRALCREFQLDKVEVRECLRAAGMIQTGKGKAKVRVQNNHGALSAHRGEILRKRNQGATQGELAKEYKVTRQGISHFLKRHYASRVREAKTMNPAGFPSPPQGGHAIGRWS